MINQKLIGSECLRCSEPKMQEDVIKCAEVTLFQRDFIKETAKELLLHDNDKIEDKDILEMLEDITNHLESRYSEELGTNQQYVGMREIFRGFVTKD